MMILGNMRESHGVTHNVSDCHRETEKGKGHPVAVLRMGPEVPLNSCALPVRAAAIVPTRTAAVGPVTRLFFKICYRLLF
jgi:hypothetical protein